MPHSFIYATGSYLPDNKIANEEFTQFPKEAAAIIREKTGIHYRRFALPGQCTSDLAVHAAVNCLDESDIRPSEIDAIILATSSPDRKIPATATRVQHHIGAHKAFAFDLNSVCSGSTYGIFLADALIKSGQCDAVLFIGAEHYSSILNKNDFTTFPYFGDGAGAVLFTPGKKGEGVLHSCLATDGAGSDLIHIPAGGSMLPYEGAANKNDIYFRMNGKKVFSFAVEQGTQIISRLLEETGFRQSDIRCFVAHQANINILRKIAENLNVPENLFYTNLREYGNTAGASVLIALDEAIKSHAIERGDLVVTVAFGGGLSWGANLIGY